MISASTSRSPSKRSSDDRLHSRPGLHDAARSPIPIIRIAPDKLRSSVLRHYGDKLILCFERPTSQFRVQAWIDAHNKKATHHLAFHAEIVNALFVVKVESSDVHAAKLALLADSPLQAIDQHASVNSYPEDFDPRNPRNFNHLVTIVINRGSEVIHEHLEEITKPIGRLVKPGTIDSGIEHYRVTALVETSLRSFTPLVQFPLENSVLTIHFTFEGRLLRCEHCFSYNHGALGCPTKFPTPDLAPNFATAHRFQDPRLHLPQRGDGLLGRPNFPKSPVHFHPSPSVSRVNSLDTLRHLQSKNTGGWNVGTQLSTRSAHRRAPSLVASLHSRGHLPRRSPPPYNFVDLSEQTGDSHSSDSTWQRWTPPTVASQVRITANSTPSSSSLPPQHVTPSFTFAAVPSSERNSTTSAPSVEEVVDHLLEQLPAETDTIADLLTAKQRRSRAKNMRSRLKEKARKQASQDRSAFTWVRVPNATSDLNAPISADTVPSPPDTTGGLEDYLAQAHPVPSALICSSGSPTDPPLQPSLLHTLPQSFTPVSVDQSSTIPVIDLRTSTFRKRQRDPADCELESPAFNSDSLDKEPTTKRQRIASAEILLAAPLLIPDSRSELVFDSLNGISDGDSDTELLGKKASADGALPPSAISSAMAGRLQPLQCDLLSTTKPPSTLGLTIIPQ